MPHPELSRLIKSLLGVGVALLVSACASSGPSTLELSLSEDNRPDLPDRPLEELARQMPPLPDRGDVVMLDVDDPTRFEFGVDPRSIQLAPGRIVRYTLWSRSDAGSVSVSWESLRCGTGERRLLAVGRPGAGWQLARDDGWKEMTRTPATNAQRSLYRGIFCAGGGANGADADDLRQKLKQMRQIKEQLRGSR